jgi:hypothetical protein
MKPKTCPPIVFQCKENKIKINYMNNIRCSKKNISQYAWPFNKLVYKFLGNEITIVFDIPM